MNNETDPIMPGRVDARVLVVVVVIYVFPPHHPGEVAGIAFSPVRLLQTAMGLIPRMSFISLDFVSGSSSRNEQQPKSNTAAAA